VLIDAGAEARLLKVAAEDWQSEDNSNGGVPLGRLSVDTVARSISLGAGSGATLRNWWRAALAIEIAGAMRAATDLTVKYVCDRVQFKRPIGAFQSVQHRLAECAVMCEGAKWLALEAIANGAPAAESAAAATYASTSAWKVFTESHQLHGAMGFTREYPLHVWSRRLLQLRPEMGGPSAHQIALAEAAFRPETVQAWIGDYGLGAG
jgi:alkylation response protein AidB-like acyl-CoA dehydrogenase